MSEATFNISLVRFAEADWKLLISYFVIIVSLSMIVYFAIFVDEKDTQVEVNLENNSVHHFVEETPAAVSSPVATTSVTPTKRRPSLGGSEKKTKTPASESKPKTPKSEKKRAESPNPVKARSTTPAKRTSSTPKQRTTTPKRAKSVASEEEPEEKTVEKKARRRVSNAAATDAMAELASPSSRRMSLRNRR